MHTQKLSLIGLCLLFSLVLAPALSAQTDDAAASVGTQYVELKPAFVTNFGGPGKLRYMKIDVTLRVANTGVNPIRHHMSQIRHQLIMLFSRQNAEDIGSMEGKELLRQQALEAVRTVLVEEDGDQQVVDLLFGSFVIQQ